MRWVRFCAVVVIVTIGAAAFTLSFAALRELAVMAHTPENLAWLWPVIVDGTIIQATVSALVLASKPQRRWFLWVLAAGALVSITGNSVHAALAGTELPWWAAALVAAVAPVSLVVDTHGLAVLFRAAQQESEPAVVAPATTPEPVPAVTAVTTEAAPSAPVAALADPAPKNPVRRDPAKVARAVALRAEGQTYAEIAQALGVSPRTAAKYAASGRDHRRGGAIQPIRAVRPVQQMLPIAVPAVGGV
ncbi:DUF2637 domain-containing protein [Nocardia vulneris]|uniref:DUF2637 domain-containing protein n=1 Tax=Nocardia vulneris TaxID=1141657 RepID=UPI00244E9EA4|nr:DUF2637 domain-containing protein [Nocardia vulneris]